MLEKVGLSLIFNRIIVRQFKLLFLGATGQSFAHFGQGTGPIQLDNVQCSGTETQLRDCSLIRTHNCAHYEDAGVTCVGQ